MNEEERVTLSSFYKKIIYYMSYPITLEEVKLHLRIDPSDNDSDSYISTYVIPSAVEYVSLRVDPSTLQYSEASTGFPFPIKQAMLIAAADLYDVNRSSYTLSSIKREDVIERLILPYKIIYW